MKKLIFLLAIGALLAPPLWGQGGTNKEIWMKELYPATSYVCKFMPDDNFIINGADNMIQIRRIEDGEIVNEINFGGLISDIEFSPDGSQFSACGDFLKVYDTETLELIRSIEMPFSEFPDNRYHGISGLSYSVDGTKLIGTAQNFEINQSVTKLVVWDTQNGEIIKEFGDTTQHYWSYVECSPDGKYIAVAMAHYPYSIYLYDANTYELVHVFYNQCLKGGGILDLRFSKDGKYLASANPMPYKLRVWNVETKELIVEEDFDVEKTSVYKFDFTSDGKYLLLSDSHSYPQVVIYNIETKQNIYTYPPNTYTQRSIHLNNDDTRFTGTSGGHVAIYSIDFSTLNVEIQNPSEDIIYPNPNNGFAQIDFNLPYDFLTTLSLNDLTGKKEIIKNEFLFKGNHSIPYNCSNLTSGTYFISITQKEYVKVVKLIME